jgi:hypothetical protein
MRLKSKLKLTSGLGNQEGIGGGVMMFKGD